MPIAALAETLIKKMRNVFGAAACNVHGQEIISQEVMGFLNRTARVQEVDISALQERIRFCLTGSHDSRNVKSQHKRAEAERDEWGRLFQYQNALEDQADATRVRIQQEAERRLKQLQTQQILERTLQRKVEQEHVQHEGRVEQARFHEWEGQETVRRQRQRSLSERVKDQRLLQLLDQTCRQEAAAMREREEDRALAQRVALDTQASSAQEEAARQTVRALHRETLMLNLSRQQQRQDKLVQKAQDDLRYTMLWEQKLDRQEQDRIGHRNKILDKQRQQLEILRTRPPDKERWLDQAIVDKQVREKEALKVLDDQRRADAIRMGRESFRNSLADQLREKDALRQQQRQEEEERTRQHMLKIAAAEAAEKERLRLVLERKLRYGQDLEAQMRADTLRRQETIMSGTEKLFNSQLLVAVDGYQAHGLPPL